MRGFMPSEVARLVLGYLKELKCEKSVGMFLNESPHLYEYVECLLKGREYPTSINGYSLLDILNDFEPSCNANQQSSGGRSNSPSSSESLSMCARDLLLAARSQHKQVELASVGCGNDDVCIRKQTGCQTSPTPINNTSLVHVDVNRVEELSQTQIPVYRTPAKHFLNSPFNTPCRPMDFYSSPTSLVKSFLNFQGSQITPVKAWESDTHCVNRLNSPRRKDSIPRKRLYSPGNSISISPSLSGKKRLIENYDSAGSSCFSSPSVDGENAVSTSGCNIEKVLFENILKNSPLQEIIATHINEELPPTISISESSDAQLTNNIRNIANNIEADPTFDSYLKSICVEDQGGNSNESQVNPTMLVETEMKGGGGCYQEKVVDARLNDADCIWSSSTSTASTSVSTNAIIDGTTLYLLPMSLSCDVSRAQLVNVGVSSSDEICKVNQSQVQIQSGVVGASESSKNGVQFSTLSPSQLSSIDIGRAQEKLARQKSMLRNRQTYTIESRKQNFAKRQCAVKSLNFQNNVSIIDQTKLRSVIQKDPIGPRLKSLIKTVETQTNKPDDQITQNKKKSNKVSDVRKENSLKPKEQNEKIVKSNKSSHNKKLTNEKSKMSREADLNNANIDKILSNVEYVD